VLSKASDIEQIFARWSITRVAAAAGSVFATVKIIIAAVFQALFVHGQTEHCGFCHPKIG